MTPVSVTLSLAAANAAAIVASNTPAGAGALTLVASPWLADKPRRVLVTAGSEASPRTIIIAGTNRDGNPQGETLTVPASTPGTVATANDFATVTAVTVAAAWSAAMTVGTNGVCSSQWFMVQRQVTPVNIGASLVIVGTANATVEYTHNDPNALPAGATVPTVWPLAALASKTSSTDGVAGITWPVVAYRVTLNSGTGSARMDAVQAGVWS